VKQNIFRLAARENHHSAMLFHVNQRFCLTDSSKSLFHVKQTFVIAHLNHPILATISASPLRPVIPTGAAWPFLSRSLLRTSRAAQWRNLSSIDRASHEHFVLIAVTPRTIVDAATIAQMSTRRHSH
jgi:hypothetical protein